MDRLEEVLIALLPELWDVGDGCIMCVRHTLDIINKPIAKYGFMYEAREGVESETDDGEVKVYLTRFAIDPAVETNE